MSAAPTPTAPAFPAKLTERLRGRPVAVADTFL